MAESEKISLAFCCLGNICRSPMAEAVAKHTIAELGYADRFGEFDSMGTAAYHVGESPDHRSAQVCRIHGVPIDHSARQVSKQDFSRFDYIFAMDANNLADLKRIQPRSSKAKVVLFGEYGYDSSFPKIVQDPYYGGVNGFERNYEQIVHFTKASYNPFYKISVPGSRKST
ncbi:phosphotyrosine protein phosphatase I superfamily [Dipodascopsis tothii]|uniref:phosphotyrosine protein phosphatase I superfamily n=1 Tax=Dipodascopsis tothii TaxID=44089 RepID=UPI0034CF1A92